MTEVNNNVVEVAAEEVTKKVGTMTKLSRAVGKVTFLTQKHAPLILTAAGIVGIGASVYTMYKARPKIEAIVDDVENRQELLDRLNELNVMVKSGTPMTEAQFEMHKTLIDENAKEPFEVKRSEMIRRYAGALALPISLAVLSSTAIGASYVIMNKRLSGLATALAVTTAEHKYLESKVSKKYGEEELHKLETVEEEEYTETNSKGKEVTKKREVRANTAYNSLSGRWFADSDEYASDSHDMNMTFLRNKSRQLDEELFRKGYLSLNRALSVLGFPLAKGGSELGWNTQSGFALDFQTTNFNETATGEIIPQVYVRWNRPISIFNDIDLNGGQYSE